MKCKIYLIIVLTLLCQYTVGQKIDPLYDLENGVLTVRQRPKTDHLLARYLEKANIDKSDSTIYAIIYQPGTCKRCEAMMKLMEKRLHKRNKKFTLITALNDKSAAEFYNKKKGYHADYYLYDTDLEYTKIFSFNNLSLDGTYFLKIDRGGRLISAVNPMFTQEKDLDNIIAKKIPMDYKSYDPTEQIQEVATAVEAFDALPKMTNAYKDIYLQIPDTIRTCLLYRSPYFNKQLFFYPDELLGGVMVFKQSNDNNMQFAHLMLPDSTEKMKFVQIEREVYDNDNKLGLIFNMVCSVGMLDQDHIAASYSLPRLFRQTDNSIAYYNKACILTRDVNTFAADSVIEFDFELAQKEFFYKHFQFSVAGNKVIIGCQKLTWPMEYNSNDYKNNAYLNPFMDEFYDTKNPFMAVFDRKSGKIIGQFGHLDDIARKSRTGYFYVDSKSVVGGNELAYTDCFSGKVYVADTSDIFTDKYCYQVFDIDESLIAPLDTTKFYTYEYTKPYNNAFFREISDLYITADKLYCLLDYCVQPNGILEDRPHSFVVVDRKSGSRQEYAFPTHNDCKVFGRGLRIVDNKTVKPFEILKHEGDTWLRVYDCTQ